MVSVPRPAEQGREGIALGLDILGRLDKSTKPKKMIEQIHP